MCTTRFEGMHRAGQQEYHKAGRLSGSGASRRYCSSSSSRSLIVDNSQARPKAMPSMMRLNPNISRIEGPGSLKPGRPRVASFSTLSVLPLSSAPEFGGFENVSLNLNLVVRSVVTLFSGQECLSTQADAGMSGNRTGTYAVERNSEGQARPERRSLTSNLWVVAVIGRTPSGAKGPGRGWDAFGNASRRSDSFDSLKMNLFRSPSEANP
ncbi:hypothetical protein BDW02DRAFT_208116 [Decorospora gaudefroyi]|uniref:Uncharacterized protein n=1 Tax=Decorospora gaudefroyi TaxID=184978 RepID=A0A6A5KLG2_9PLEO|nr:hypothetical protein BDW02DRAFT_208116 [Decorospora gaudefroyi]